MQIQNWERIKKTNDRVIQEEIINIASDASESIEDEDYYLEDFDCYGKECVYPSVGRGTAANQRLCLFFVPELQGAECKEISTANSDSQGRATRLGFTLFVYKLTKGDKNYHFLFIKLHFV